MTGFGFNVNGFGSFPSRGGPYDAQILIIAGGGAAPYIWAGGGGAGGVRSIDVSEVPLGVNWSIVVGAGGAAGKSTSPGHSGSQSYVDYVTDTYYTAGGGGGQQGPNSGGAASSTPSGQGNAGGIGPGQFVIGPYAYTSAGGGGGKGASGGHGTANKGGNGGNGEAWLDGTTRAGGGGGGHGQYPGGGSGGDGGSGGGGNGGNYNNYNGSFVNPNAGGTNTGGGGGGTGDQPNNGTRRAGGSGIVIIRYEGGQIGTGGTITSAGGYTYHTFTSSGTYGTG